MYASSWISGATKDSGIKNEYIKYSVEVASIVDKISKNRLR